MADRPRPFDGIDDLLDRLNRQIETAARSWESQVDTRSQLDLSMSGAETSLDLTDEGDEFVVTVDVPGYESDDLELRLSGQTVAVSGEREQRRETGGDEETYIRRERKTQSFSRQIRVPEPVDVDAVRASVNNGILTIRLPKHEPSTDAHSIDID
ncbi:MULTISPECIES: Hsp20/alpha crystallin family protein [Natrinema]|uniref:Heat shock protein Hsp20 n=1 Tax=Natrinema gari JCM 14663 TaxID=1230459 RepID=L9ZBA0_9EURY|nr:MULTISPECIES: Hsp20/alpha crystallin family protein [Natrinema]AFO56036.1 heat shock protein Hsp20 [Natrinema sp. J7-2]ELY83760.1 heat shock protein Hsp20 [Natrinema gari JCM 14663]